MNVRVGLERMLSPSELILLNCGVEKTLESPLDCRAGFSLVVVSGGYSLVQCVGCSFWWLFMLPSMGCRARGLSCPSTCGVFLGQGSGRQNLNPGPSQASPVLEFLNLCNVVEVESNRMG